MSELQHGTVIEARVVHAKSNALRMAFTDGPGEPFATAAQGAGDGRGKKLGTLFGFNNGGTGHHRVTHRDGTTLDVQSRDGAPTVLTRNGAPFATVERGASSTVTGADGTPLLQVIEHPAGGKTLELFRLLALDPSGAQVASLDVVRREAGWSLGRVAEAAWNEVYWFDRAGRALPVPLLGTRVVLDRPVNDTVTTLLLGICTDIAIGLRPYCAAMT